ncbi:hypothetical protein OF117_21855 [Geodermatophilus sp. YIM 151500]|uniref:hypothetical protein n=1 Tax=Geodermatophilus sp. YIM 151500 TaxID=2984531 RepID=UPI0021E4D571|nr:hypothetical protein [Geodermatophilus sp. YIM 151500]MCV2491997.1 hypothetical protein [Geodermatophilus sp. YIM 151500]
MTAPDRNGTLDHAGTDVEGVPAERAPGTTDPSGNVPDDPEVQDRVAREEGAERG